MSRLRLSLLGGFSVTLDDQTQTEFESDKVRALLAYIAMNVDRPQRREYLAALLWPELSERRARHNLRQVLFNLRTVIGDHHTNPAFLAITPQTIHLNSSANISSDVAYFSRAVSACQEHSQDRLTFCSQCLKMRAEAAGIYRGRFLQGLTLKNCQEFNEWALIEAQNLHFQAVSALNWLVDIHHGLGRFEQMLAYARQWITLEPYDEAAHTAVMLALGLSKQWEAAIKQYEVCRNLFTQELGVNLDAQTDELYRHISAGELPIEYASLPVIQADLSIPLGECPYRGLAAFREADAPLFFGREVFSQRVQACLQSYPAFTVILGPSGSGKSSVVYAGLLPGLKQADQWLIAEMRPGSDPFQALNGALQSLPQLDLPEAGLINQVGAGKGKNPFDLTGRVAQLGERSKTVLLILDQFEELYTLCPDIETRHNFLSELLQAVEVRTNYGDRRCLILLTLRADFMGQALSYRPFADALQDACLLMGPMNREELMDAIQKPAEIQGVRFESGLVARLLDDVGEEPGNLPLLEFALTLLWEQGENGVLTHAAYEKIGRVQGALANYAEIVYNLLSVQDQERARSVFLQLVQPGDGTEDTRRVARRAEFSEVQWSLIQHLADRRLVVTGRDQAGNEYVEVAHEALIHSWGRFQEWMQADRGYRAWQERLRWNLRQWERSDQDEGALLRGLPLIEAENWLAERGNELNLAEQRYIQASSELKQRRQRAVDLRRKWLVSVLASGLLIALLLVFFIWQQRQESRRQASIGLASQAVAELQGSDPERAVLLALEALENYPYTWQAEKALGEAISEGRLRQILVHDDFVNTAEWSADGTKILTGSSDGTARIWEASTGNELLRISAGAPAFVRWSPDEKSILAVNVAENILKVWDIESRSVRITLRDADIAGAIQINPEQWLPWSPDSSRFLTYNKTGMIKIWDAETGRVLSVLDSSLSQGADSPTTPEDLTKLMHSFLTDENDQALWSPDGETIAASSQALNQVILWSVESGQVLYAIPGDFEDQRIFLASWSPSGDRFAARGMGGVKVYDRLSGELQLSLSTPGTIIYRAIWSPDGSFLLSSGLDDGTARLWNADSGDEVMRMPNLVFAAGSDWSAGGEYLAVGGSDGLVHVWELAKDRQIRALSGTQPRITLVKFSPNGDQLLAVGDDNLVQIYDLSEAVISLRFETHNISGPVWTPDGGRIAMGLDRTKVKVWDAASGDELVTLAGHQDYLWLVEWSPTGDRLATASNDQTVIIWDAQTWTQEMVFKGHAGPVFWSAWSPDGSRIASSSQSEVIVWDSHSGEEILTFSDHAGLVFVCLWSPDGGRILSVGSNGEALIWDATSGDILHHLFPEDFQIDILAAAWARDGRFVYIQSADAAIRVFDSSTGREQLEFVTPWSTASKISVSPNGTRLLKGGDGGVKVWDLQTGTEVISYVYPGWVDAGYSPDGTLVAMASNLGTLEIYPTWQSTQELIDYARECCLVRELTSEERDLFGLPARGD